VETILHAVGSKPRVVSGRPSMPSGSHGSQTSFFRTRMPTTLALPLMEVFHNAEDESGYLLKQSAGGLAGSVFAMLCLHACAHLCFFVLGRTLRRWKKRFVVLSHVSAELQHYNPTRRALRGAGADSLGNPLNAGNWKDHIRRIPFSKLLVVKKVDKKAFRVQVSSAYIDPSVIAKAAQAVKVCAARRRRAG
jgi:hypothetical protein